MKTEYKIEIWNEFDENFVLDCLEKVYRRNSFSVTNFHKTDRIHEHGIDLFCEKNSEKVAIQAKMKPRKGDIEQFTRFEQNTHDARAIYVHIENPTRPFKDHTETQSGSVEFWNADALHKFLVRNESIEYCCIYFSRHPMVLSLIKAHSLILGRRKSNYTKHRFTAEEIAKLWVVKDNSVKVWVSLYFVYRKWSKILMAKTQKDEEEFESVLGAIFEDLDMAYSLSGAKLVSSIEDFSEKHPDLIGLYWKLVSQRSGWNIYTTHVDRVNSSKKSLFFTSFNWICPLHNESKRGIMKGFYSSMNYILENFQEVAKNIEDGVDWVFEEMKS